MSTLLLNNLSFSKVDNIYKKRFNRSIISNLQTRRTTKIRLKNDRSQAQWQNSFYPRLQTSSAAILAVIFRKIKDDSRILQKSTVFLLYDKYRLLYAIQATE